MSDQKPTKDDEEQAKLRADQIPAGDESAFLSSNARANKKTDKSAGKDDGQSADNSTDESAEDTQSLDTISSRQMDTMVGKIVANRYELISFIGHGGMSVVYKALDKQLGKTVAVKLLLPHLVNDPITYQRFQQEARAASSLSHPNIVTIYDFGSSDDAMPYIVMDYLDGTPLNDAIKMLRGLALERSVAIFVQIADALQCAHNNNVLHRDLKPSNVLLIHQGPTLDIVKLVDFGIAKLIPQDGGESLHLTKTGEVFGSPFYMSPEQCRGEKVDARSDIYSMGCLMYEVIVGKPPIMGANLMETLYKQLSEVPASFSVACPDSKVPERLEAIVFKALHKDPAMRQQSMDDLATDLHAFLNEMEAGWITNAKLKLELLRLKMAPLVGRERTLLWIALAAVIVTGIITAQYLSIYFKDTREPPPGAATAWSVIEPTPDEPAKFSAHMLLMQRNLKAYKDLYGKTSMEYVKQESFVAKKYEECGHFREAVDLRKHIFEVFKELDGAKTDETLAVQKIYAKDLFRSGDWQSAASVYSDLYETMYVDGDIKNLHPKDQYSDTKHDTFNEVCESLANSFYASGRYKEAATYYEVLIGQFKKYRETTAAQLQRHANALCRLGDCYRMCNQYNHAENAYTSALTILKDNKLDEACIVATTRLLGFVHFQEEHYKRARELYEEALPKLESTLGESDPDVIAALREYSQLMWKKGNYFTSVMTDLRVKELQAKRQHTSFIQQKKLASSKR